ncbi:MAG: hypothetical protein EZS28_037496, partial [Streblomastix strix]
AGVIVVASIVAMIIVAVVIQHQKYSGLGRRGPPADSDVNSLNHERRIDAFEYEIKKKYIDGDEIPKSGVRIVNWWNAISVLTEQDDIPIGLEEEEQRIDILMQIRLPKQKKKSLRRKFAIKESSKVI